MNTNKKKIFIYTDSRGFEISKMYYRKSPFNSYLSHYIKKYNCDVFICPEKHTTIFDFLYQLKNSGGAEKFDYVIAHIGVVDFSPRPLKEVLPILNLKKHKIIEVFGQDFYSNISNIDVYPQEYMGQQTASLLSEKHIEIIAEKFNSISNFIWITCNPVDVSWRGNYMRDRPLNINMVNEKSVLLKNKLNTKIGIIDITDWSIEEVHQYTCDNIHLSIKGMNLIKNKIELWISKN